MSFGNVLLNRTKQVKFTLLINFKIIMAKINVKDTQVTILKIDETDYISLTDIARYKIRKTLMR